MKTFFTHLMYFVTFLLLSLKVGHLDSWADPLPSYSPIQGIDTLEVVLDPAQHPVVSRPIRPRHSSVHHPENVTHYQLVPPGYAAITLDDGPSKTTKQGRNYTTEVLDVLKEKQVLATFFVVGHALDRKGGPALVQRAALEGHSIANHSWSHSYMSVDCFNEDDTINRPCTDTEAAAEILNTQSLLTETLAEVGMRPVPFFRFPGGNSNGRLKDLVSSLGFSSVFWDIETNDTSSDTTPESYVTHTVSEFNRRDGGIILAHDRREITANTLGTFIDTLRVQEKFEGFVVFRQP